MIATVVRRSLPVGAWPGPERLGWLSAVDLEGRLFTARPRPRWRPSTIRAMQGSYGRWLAWAKDEYPDLYALGPADRLTRDTVNLYVVELRRRLTDRSIGTALVHLLVVVRLLSPDFDSAWLRPIVSRLRRTRGSTRRKGERIVASGELLRLGLELMDFDDVPVASRGHASLLRYRDGLIIAVLALRPLRMGNFLSVRLKVHLSERHGELWLCFPREETKNGVDVEFPFPVALRRHLSNYLRVVRKRLQVIGTSNGIRANDWLWLAQNGSPMGRQTLRNILLRRTEKRFGKRLGPNLFRDCLATSLAEAGPDIDWTIPYLLGHRTAATSQGSYVHTGGFPEQSTFQRHLNELRRKGTRSR